MSGGEDGEPSEVHLISKVCVEASRWNVLSRVVGSLNDCDILVEIMIGKRKRVVVL
jgi:hypothetical protein